MSALCALLLAAAQAPALSHAARVEPPAAAVGEPIEVVCEVEHPAGVRPRALDPELDPSAPFVFLGARREPLRAGPEKSVTRLAWRFVGLEPGAAAPPPVEYAWREADGERRATVGVEGLSLTGVLAEGEDAPRPLLPFRELPEAAPERALLPAVLLPLAGAMAALALLAAGFLARQARLRHRAPAPSGDDPAARLAALLAGGAGGASARTRHYELTRLVREAFDRRAGVDLRGLTDLEWAGALAQRGELAPEARTAATQVLAVAGGPKYAGERPTEYREREAFERAAAALRALEARP